MLKHVATHLWHLVFLNMWASPRVRRDILGRERCAGCAWHIFSSGPSEATWGHLPNQLPVADRPQKWHRKRSLTVRCTQVWQHAIMSSIYSGKIGKPMWKLDQLLNHPHPNWPWGWCQALETSNRCVVSQPDQMPSRLCRSRTATGMLLATFWLQRAGAARNAPRYLGLGCLWIPLDTFGTLDLTEDWGLYKFGQLENLPVGHSRNALVRHLKARKNKRSTVMHGQPRPAETVLPGSVSLGSWDPKLRKSMISVYLLDIP